MGTKITKRRAKILARIAFLRFLAEMLKIKSK